jgi:hypothetical protein
MGFSVPGFWNQTRQVDFGRSLFPRNCRKRKMIAQCPYNRRNVVPALDRQIAAHQRVARPIRRWADFVARSVDTVDTVAVPYRRRLDSMSLAVEVIECRQLWPRRT